MSDENNQGGGGDDNWVATLPEALRSAPFIKPGEDGKVKPMDQVLADLTNAAQHMGNSIRMPGPDAGADDIKAFQQKVMEKIPGLMVTPNMEDADSMSATFGKLGRPESADSYKVPEGAGIEGEQLGQLKAIAHKANLTQGQFAEYLSSFSTANKSVFDQAQLKQEEGMAALKGEWGTAFDDRLGQVTSFLKTNSATPDHVLQSLQQGNLPADQVRWLHSLAEAISNEDGQFHKQENNGSDKLAPDEALSQLGEVEKRIFNREQPPTADELKVLTDKRMKLMRMAYPQG